MIVGEYNKLIVDECGLFLWKGNKLESLRPMVTKSGAFAQTRRIRRFVESNRRHNERGASSQPLCKTALNRNPDEWNSAKHLLE